MRWRIWCTTMVLACFRPPPPEEVRYFSFSGKTFLAKPCRIYDGDTFSSVFQYRGEWLKWRCRCLGYDSPEMKPLLSKPHREKEKELAVLARDRLEALLTRTECVRIECGEFDKYGRILVVVYSHNLREEDKQSINDRMLEEGHGVPL